MRYPVCEPTDPAYRIPHTVHGELRFAIREKVLIDELVDGLLV